MPCHTVCLRFIRNSNIYVHENYITCRLIYSIWFSSVPNRVFWLVGQMVKTPPFHGGVTSSILVRAIGNWLDKVRALKSIIPRWGNLAQLVEHWCEVPS